MSSLVQVTYSLLILCVSIILALRYSKNLLNKDPGLSPYWWGYFVGFTCLLSPVNSIVLYFSGSVEEMGVTIFAPWQIISLAFTVLIGIGLILRMKLGWWALFANLAISPFVVMKSSSANAEMMEAFPGVLVVLYWTMGISGVIYAVINVVYARKRWPEFMPVRQSLNWK